MLGEIRDYLKQRGAASLNEIAIHFGAGADATELALNYWINKGKVHAIAPPCESSCNGCAGAEHLYQWIGRETPVQWYRKRS